MKFIYVLEDDIRTQKEIFESIQSIDSKLAVRFFLNLAEFHEFLKLGMAEGPLALAKSGQRHELDLIEPVAGTPTDTLRLVIAKDEFMGTQNMGLLRRLREFLIRKQMCSAEEPTAAILTAFDSPEFDIKLAEEGIINNVIFKPFDKLILKQHLEFALAGRHPLENASTVATMKLSSSIEMLKEVPFESLTEWGFRTVNNHEITIGKIAKYYDGLFETDSKRGLFATCISCKEINEKEFLCEFAFLGADLAQIQKIRRHILQNKAHKQTPFTNAQGVPFHILICEDEQAKANDLKLILEEKFDHVKVEVYSSVAQLIVDLEDKETAHRRELPDSFDLVLANLEIFHEDGDKKWEQLTKAFSDRSKRRVSTEKVPDLALFTNQKQTAEQIRVLLGWCKEVFFFPWDRLYFVRKLLVQWTGLTPKAETQFSELHEAGTLKVANPVEITQISEGGLILKYYRGITIGAFREFILWRPDELVIPEIIGTCNFTEKDPTGEAFLNHFVFFGMKDHYLKHVRIWLLDAYIKQKEKG